MAKAPHTCQPCGQPEEWTKDAAERRRVGFYRPVPRKSALLFNNVKGPLRAAILKYAESVAKKTATGNRPRAEE